MGPGDNVVRDVVLYTALTLGAGVLTALRAVSVRRGRLAWLTLGVGLVLMSAGDAVYSIGAGSLPQDGAPALADGFYVAFYLAVYVAVALLVRDQVRDTPWSAWLDGFIAALALGAGLLAIVTSRHGSSLEGTSGSSLAYPLADTALIAMVVFGLVLVGRTGRPVFWWFVASLVLMASADLLYADRADRGVYVQGTWIDALWPLAAIGLAVAAWRPSPDGSRRRASQVMFLVAPVGSLALATAVLVQATTGPAQGAPVAMAAAAISLVGVRMAASVAQAARLADARRIAATDELTGLPNRHGFVAAAATAFDDDATAWCALLVIDLDGFKEVNESLGHEAGDRVLASVARLLQESLRSPRDIIGRLGGDEFALLLPATDRRGADNVARRIHAALSTPVTVDGVRLQVAASIGSATSPDDGTDLSSLLRRAEIAMNRAKSARLGDAAFDERIDRDGEHRLQQIGELRSAIDDGELVLHYQPKVSLRTGHVVAVEALVRWDKPGHGLVLPDDFLPLAEAAGLMPALTAFVLEEAVAHAAQGAREGGHLPVAVNLPTSAIVDAGLPETIRAVLARHGAPSGLLQIEITEEALLQDRARARAVLATLRGDGIWASIDDYGSGYSSLAYLRELTVDEVKLDKDFVMPMADDPRAAAIVRSTIDLAHALGLSIVAEGVEDERVASMLSEYGCDTAQGYYWTRPLAADQLHLWLADADTPALAGLAEPAGP